MGMAVQFPKIDYYHDQDSFVFSLDLWIPIGVMAQGLFDKTWL